MSVEDANLGKNHLSRRSFLVGLTVLGISSATAMSLGVNVANAAPESETTSRAKGGPSTKEAEGKKVEVVREVDPDDPLKHFNQPYYRHRRRVARRYYRRGRRYARRTYRRVRRRAYYY
jgi:hypothetical protein